MPKRNPNGVLKEASRPTDRAVWERACDLWKQSALGRCSGEGAMLDAWRPDAKRNSLDVKREELPHLRDAGNLLRWGYDKRQIPRVLEGRIEKVS